MKVFEKKSSLTDCISILKQENNQIGFVPTMGALHKGHLSLVKQSKNENSISVVSIFVNPTQFDNSEDLKKYPKTLENDLALLRSIGCDIVFIPSVEEIYKDNVSSKSYTFDGIEHQMEGKFREGHFDGVATIVHTLFDLVKPSKAYFGEKDFQQLQIIKKLVHQEQLPVEVIGCPIFRESDGLAMSSRNTRLTKEHRVAAPFIYKILSIVSSKVHSINIDDIISFVEDEFQKNSFLDLEYFSIAEEETLLEATSIVSHKKYRAFIAVNAGNIRLIDNIALGNNT